MKIHAPLRRTARVACLAAIGLCILSGDLLAQRRTLPPNPREPMRRAPTVGQVRDGRPFLGVRVGLANPVGAFGDAASSGASLGVLGGTWISRSMRLRVRLDLDRPGSTILGGEGPQAGLEGPGWTLFFGDAGLQYEVTGGRGPFMMMVDLGLGGVVFDSGLSAFEVSELYFAVSPGLSFGTALSDWGNFVVDGRYRFIMGDEMDYENLLPDPKDNLGHVQITAGLEFYLSR